MLINMNLKHYYNFYYKEISYGDKLYTAIILKN